MVFEKFFFQKKHTTQESADEVIDVNKRKTLIGLGAAAAALALSPGGVEASDAPNPEAHNTSVLPELEPVRTPEEKERNIEKLFAYAASIQQHKEQLRTLTSRKEIEAIIYSGLPALEEGALVGTELDFKETIRKKGWPAISFRNAEKREVANSFIVNNTVLVNQHELEGIEGGVTAEGGADLAAIDLTGEHEIVREKRGGPSLSWDPESAQEDLHGRIVFIPTTHKTPDGFIEELVPAVLVKITPNFLFSGTKGTFFGEKNTTAFKKQFEYSYLAVVAPLDSDGNKVRNGSDVAGMSGSPLLTLEDCALGKRNVSGIAWGNQERKDDATKTSRSLIFVHGADVVGNMLTQINRNYAS